MRIACVRVPSFSLSVERLANPSLGGPLIVTDQSTVLDASPELAIQSGLPVRQAKARAPNATFLEARHTLYREAFEAMLDAMEQITPAVQAMEPGTACGDLVGLLGHYRDEFDLAGALVDAVHDATGLRPAVGVADGKFVAWVAAFETPPGDAGIVPSGREGEFLREKDAALLPIDLEILQRLDLLALRSLGEIADLPRTALEAQFPRDGGRMWELANGIDHDLVLPRKRDLILTKRLNFNAAVAENGSLVAASKQLLSGLCRRLKGRTAGRVHVQLLNDERMVWERSKPFRDPTGDVSQMHLVVKTMLSLLELPEAVDAISITLTGIGHEVARQAKLFTDSSRNFDRLAADIRELHARYGRPVVYQIVEVNPRSRHPEERMALVPFEP